MTPEQAKEILDELHELSPEPLYNGGDYFDNEELKHGTNKDTKSETSGRNILES